MNAVARVTGKASLVRFLGAVLIGFVVLNAKHREPVWCHVTTWKQQEIIVARKQKSAMQVGKVKIPIWEDL